MTKTRRPLAGMLVLDCSPFKVPGCGESDETYPFEVTRRIIKGATVGRMTSRTGDLLEPVLAAARELESDGAEMIIGDCGFLALFQGILQETVRIPVITSSLLLVPLVSKMIPHRKRIGILTYRADTLKEEHFSGAGWNSSEIPVAVAGMEDGKAWQLFRAPERAFHTEQLQYELLDVCRDLMARYPDIGAFVLECSVMPVFAHRIREQTGLPVFDITSLAALAAEGLWRTSFWAEKQ